MTNTIATQTASELSIFDMTKQERESFVVKVVEAIEDGYDPLKIHYRLKVVAKIIDMLTDDKTVIGARYKELLLLEAAKHPGKAFNYEGATIEVKEMGIRYDWSKCGDPYLLADMLEMETLKDKIKARQELIKTVPASGMQTIIEDEIVVLYPPTKTSTTGIALTLK